MTDTCAGISGQTYLDHFKRDGERIAEVARDHLEAEVPTCPGNTVGSLLLHTASVCMFWRDVLIQNRQPQSDWTTFPTDALDALTSLHADVVRELGARDPDSSTWTWFGEGPVRFWYRRSAQEFAVHRWDFENAVGQAIPIDPTLAADGIDEMLFVFGAGTGSKEYLGGSERFDGNGETLRLEPTDHPSALTVAALPDRFEVSDTNAPDVTARGSASDLLLFLWGRVPPSVLDVDGDVSLLERWQERVKI
jgi:uncharacterized protein (TIGR03083 family)